jgi:hypothetical protein
MHILRKGSKGQEVETWQIFLRGFSSKSSLTITGNFDDVTERETKSFQSRKGLVADGVVGPQTLSIALKLGFPLMVDPVQDENGPNWPPQPNTTSLGYADREKIFGKFSYVSSPTQSNPEAITITGNWLNNISQIHIPQLSGIPGAPRSSTVPLHASIAPQVTKLFQAWHDEGLTYLILSWGGSWVPRFIRGSRTILSNHAWGTAFDINVQWNHLGTVPALKGATGSVRELVEIAYDHGMYWGGWFAKRPDGMHFEAYKIL